MAITYQNQYTYQIREYLKQFLRIFTGITVDYDGNDYDGDGNPDKKQVNVIYANMDRVIAERLHTAGTFTAASLPLISGYLSAINRDDERRKSPTHIDRRAYMDENNNVKSLERLMPVPYKASMQIFIFSDNTNMKFQILETILSLFNPDLTFNKNNDVKDWTNISRAELMSISTEENMPTGTDGRLIIDTLDFEVDLWLNFPFKDGDSGIIKQVELNMLDSSVSIVGLDSATIV